MRVLEPGASFSPIEWKLSAAVQTLVFQKGVGRKVARGSISRPTCKTEAVSSLGTVCPFHVFVHARALVPFHVYIIEQSDDGRKFSLRKVAQR